jgi:hypothetical protein
MSETTTPPQTGAATGGVCVLLRLEGMVLFVGMTLLYGLWGTARGGFTRSCSWLRI